MTTTSALNDTNFLRPPPSQARNDELGQSDFLTLMITQFKNQDPFKPMENGEFLGQLAQFSTVSGIDSLNASFAGLTESLQGEQALQAAVLGPAPVQRVVYHVHLLRDELRRLQLEHIEVSPGEGMTIFLPRSKTDRNHVGRTFKAPALSRLCPVAAYQDWVANAGLTEGPVFRRIDRWGRVGQRPLHRDSITALLRERFRILSERPSKNG